MRSLKLILLIAIMALWIWIAFLNFGKYTEWTLPGLGGYLNWPVGLLMLVSFLVGAVPMWLVHKVARWGWNRKLTKAEQKLSDHVAATTPQQMAMKSAADEEAALLARARAAGGGGI